MLVAINTQRKVCHGLDLACGHMQQIYRELGFFLLKCVNQIEFLLKLQKRKKERKKKRQLT
jgi:hypothetical protein